jgi:hypothetical protein
VRLNGFLDPIYIHAPNRKEVFMNQETSQAFAGADAGVPEVSQPQAGIMDGINKIKSVLSSRKFWAAAIAALSAAAAFATGQIDAWQLVQALVAVAAAYSTGVAIEDAGYHIGGQS